MKAASISAKAGRKPQQSRRRARLAVGLISGTSMDGIDAALVHIGGSASQPRVRLRAFVTAPYPGWLRRKLLEIAGGGLTTAEEIDQLNTLLGAAFGEAAVRVCRRARVNPASLSVIGSHGQTIHHFGGMKGSADQPSKPPGKWIGAGGQTARLEGPSTQLRCTFQIAEPALIAERTGAPVVADFRPADVAAGGQGAPLVPMVDYLLLRDARQGTVALNIGGIANLTVIPAGAEPEQVFGFDTGPGNIIIDALVRRFTQGKRTYDAGGRWAAKGQVVHPLLKAMLSHPFFERQPPKSAGREQFGEAFLNLYFFPHQMKTDGSAGKIDKRQATIENLPMAPPEDLLRTATELTARSIAGAMEKFVLGRVAVHRLIVSGGGAHNRLLMKRLGELLPKLKIHCSDEFGLDVDAKEAIAFAVLADRTLQGLPGNLPAVTGARRPVVLGKIARP